MVPSLIEQIVSGLRHNLALVFNFVHVIIVESEPLTLILSQSSVVPSKKLSVVIRNRKQIVNQSSWWFLFLGNNVLRHIKTLDWKVNQLILLGGVSFKSFQIDDKNRRCLKNLYLFDGLLMLLALVAEPSIRVTQFLRRHELLKAIVNCNFICLSLI